MIVLVYPVLGWALFIALWSVVELLIPRRGLYYEEIRDWKQAKRAQTRILRIAMRSRAQMLEEVRRHRCQR